MVIAGASYPNYFLQGVIEEDLAIKELSGFNPRTTVMVFSSSFSVVCNDHRPQECSQKLSNLSL